MERAAARVDVLPVGPVGDRLDARAGPPQRVRPEPEGRAVSRVHDHSEAFQPRRHVRRQTREVDLRQPRIDWLRPTILRVSACPRLRVPFP